MAVEDARGDIVQANLQIPERRKIVQKYLGEEEPKIIPPRSLFSRSTLLRFSHRAGISRMNYKDISTAGPNGSNLIQHIGEKFLQTVILQAAENAIRRKTNIGGERLTNTTIQIQDVLEVLLFLQSGQQQRSELSITETSRSRA